MDIVWVLATAGLWVASVEMAYGLSRLQKARELRA
jgi:hypothetical protein